ncbi:glucose-6-phosphate/phosphate translocator 1 chloroplastic [Phtheirospermum japonicum]|uniref:Glucose-6-phosphate/phosphate translocator 1 chloroplastic n=1 Tax=Phtheirospermum japonicum TaxID=374723 RepID=A0A830CVZ9_9LAMI|nr:glucose-6-phosphate/phosphate translocator 1 chloroplastic [Phtheirospermum japonicum]
MLQLLRMSKVAVSFTHIIKSGETSCSVLVSRFILGETFPPAIYLSLFPIIGGGGLADLTEINFNIIGFMGSMISNLAFVFRSIFSKKGMKGKSVSGMNYYACLSIMSLLILTPFDIYVERPQMWAAGFKEALSQIGPQISAHRWMAAKSIFYHFYNQVSYMTLDEISPLTFSIGNTMKRISVIVSSIIIFQTPVQPVNALGAEIAVLGTSYTLRFAGPNLSLFFILGGFDLSSLLLSTGKVAAPLGNMVGYGPKTNSLYSNHLQTAAQIFILSICLCCRAFH